MSEKSLRLVVVTQERELLQQVVGSVTVMTTDGEVTILPNHQPLFTRLSDGELSFKAVGESKVGGAVAISGGFMDVSPDGVVTILADYALRSDEINEARAQEARQRAEEMLKNKQSEQEFLLAEASLRRALTELKVAERRKVRQQL